MIPATHEQRLAHWRSRREQHERELLTGAPSVADSSDAEILGMFPGSEVIGSDRERDRVAEVADVIRCSLLGWERAAAGEFCSWRPIRNGLAAVGLDDPELINRACDRLGVERRRCGAGERWRLGTAPAPSESVGAAALRHASERGPVFPCDPGSKRPLTPRGFCDATRDPETIRRWFDHRRPPMIGLPTGAASGLVVLDVDGDEGAESLRQVEREHEPLPRTASVVTPGGGQHFYFGHPGGVVPNSAGKLGPGLDIRGDGGYVIVPPSRAASGRRYEVDEESPAAPMPGWLVALVRGPAKGNGKVTPAGEWVRIVRDGLAQGERNDGLARLTGHLLRRNVDMDLAAELVHLANGRCRPPLPREEVERIIDSIAGRELRRRGEASR